MFKLSEAIENDFKDFNKLDCIRIFEILKQNDKLLQELNYPEIVNIINKQYRFIFNKIIFGIPENYISKKFYFENKLYLIKNFNYFGLIDNYDELFEDLNRNDNIEYITESELKGFEKLIKNYKINKRFAFFNFLRDKSKSGFRGKINHFFMHYGKEYLSEKYIFKNLGFNIFIKN